MANHASPFLGMTWDEAGELSARRERVREWVSDEDAELVRLVAEGYRTFWARRGKRPPPVSDTVLDTVEFPED